MDGVVAPQQNSITDIIGDSLGFDRTIASTAEPTSRMTSTPATRLASPARLTLASGLGNEIDGAWWPRSGLISRELPDLVSVLDLRLGRVIDINVNWSSLQRPPDLDWDGRRGNTSTRHDGCPAHRESRAHLRLPATLSASPEVRGPARITQCRGIDT